MIMASKSKGTTKEMAEITPPIPVNTVTTDNTAITTPPKVEGSPNCSSKIAPQPAIIADSAPNKKKCNY